MTTQPQSESQCMSVVAYQGQKDVLEAIINLERRTFPKADSWAGIMCHEVKRHNTTLLFASKEGKVFGYILYTTTQLKVHISKVAVDKAFRRQGIAKKLIQECLHRAVKARGVMCSTLHVDPANEAARLLYLGMGFTCDSILEDYYGPSRPCWMMMKEL